MGKVKRIICGTTSNMGAALGCYERALSRAPTSTTAVVAGSLEPYTDCTTMLYRN